ncbi:MAG: carbohydrate binding domain-containing protein [Paludibacter sp.]
MKKAIILALVLFSGFTAFAQSYTLKNGGFENGNLIKGPKNAVEGNDWFWQADQNKVPGSTIELSTTEKNKGKNSLKMTAIGEVLARYNVTIIKKLGIVPKLNYTLTFWAKSNADVKLNCNYDGFIIKEGTAVKASAPGDGIKILGTNKWEKYTVQLKGKLFSGGGTWDLTQPINFNLGLEKQTLSDNLEFYIDDLELLD